MVAGSGAGGTRAPDGPAGAAVCWATVVKVAICACAAALLMGIASSQARAVTLPDGRGYELVSPKDKNGAEIMPDSQRARAAADGSAVGFAALAGFADVQSVGASADYVAVRTGTAGTNGWATHAISPPQTTMPFIAATHFMEPLYWGEFSDDLSRGVFRSFSPVTNAPLVANEQNLYLRNDLRTPGAGSYQLLTDCPACSSPIPAVTDSSLLEEQSFFADASDDFGHLLFESRLPLTTDSTADPDVPTWNLFEWDHGTIRLAGVLPDSACGAPPCAAPASQAGQGAMNAVYTPHMISADGSRIFFTVPAASCPLQFTGCGDLYLRSDHATTVHINASEKTNGGGPGGTDPGGPMPAQYGDASSDGSRAFFLSQEALTDDAPVSLHIKLYMYSVTPDGQGHHLTFLSVDNQPSDGTSGDGVRGVLGVSDDGHTVYFGNGGGQLVAGQPTTIAGVADKLFRWHDGTLAYVGGISFGDMEQNLVNVTINYLAVVKQARVTPDGRFLLFTADRGTGLTGYNHGSCPGNGTSDGTCRELYLYRADDTPHLVCVSCNPNATRATSDALDIVHTGVGGAAVTSHLNHPITDDGRRVFFSSGDPLVAQDTNGRSDVYQYDVPTGALHLLTGGSDSSSSYFLDASRNGDDVFLLTRQRLVGWDGDGGYDVYDARVGGGLPEPVARPVCGADTCRGPVAAPPADAEASSETARGSNVRGHARRPARRRACGKGKVRKRVHGRVRCVKRHKPRAHARHRGAR